MIDSDHSAGNQGGIDGSDDKAKPAVSGNPKSSLQNRIDQLIKQRTEAQKTSAQLTEALAKSQGENAGLADQVKLLAERVAEMGQKVETPAFPSWDRLSGTDLVKQGTEALSADQPDPVSFMRSTVELATRQAVDTVKKALGSEIADLKKQLSEERQMVRQRHDLEQRIRGQYGASAFDADSPLRKAVISVSPLVEQRFGVGWENKEAAVELAFSLGRSLLLEQKNKDLETNLDKLREHMKTTLPTRAIAAPTEDGLASLKSGDVDGAIHNLRFMKRVRGELS